MAGAGPLILLYPKWIPGYHSPQNPIELLAGLEIRAGETVLDWRRDPVEIYAFHVEVPSGIDTLDIRYQFLSPTTPAEGDVVVTHNLINLQWARLLLYPAGFYARQIRIRPRLTLPQGWIFASALAPAGSAGASFEEVSLDVLVDTPVMAGRHGRRIVLEAETDVQMALFADTPEHLEATDAQLDTFRDLVREACTLFASRHFDRYRFLVALSDELGGGGVEHHRSAEIIVKPDWFADWDRMLPTRDVLAHELTHSWNGKFRRGEDSWTPSFETPIRNSLMWVYEGQTQYWGHVPTARSGLWTPASAREALAKVAATSNVRPGAMWRTMADTTRDPIIAARAPLPWPGWQRNEDYYAEGQLLWLEIDTLIRELTEDERSLDDFARLFFGAHDGSMTTCLYDADEVVETLNTVTSFDWKALINNALQSREPGVPLEGLRRGGYQLVYRDHRSDFCKAFDALYDQFDLRFSLGINVSADGTLQEVMWGSPAFDAGLTAGSSIETVDGAAFEIGRLNAAMNTRGADGTLELGVATRAYRRGVRLRHAGHRFPHLERLGGGRARLDDILAPRTS